MKELGNKGVFYISRGSQLYIQRGQNTSLSLTKAAETAEETEGNFESMRL